MVAVEGDDNRVQEVSSISRALKGLARELRIPVDRDLTAEPRAQNSAQISADPERPERSGSIEQIGRLMFFRP